MKGLGQLLSLFVGAAAASSEAVVYTNASYGIGGFAFPYPWAVHYYNFTSQQQTLSMAYMDVQPAEGSESKGSIVLLHGKNFCGATWVETAKVLSAEGYRVLIPDQIGFCKSSKPAQYQFTLHQLASNTNGLLKSAGINNATILGHSMGGMLSARYALMFPTQTTQLIMVNPLGLEDWQSLGVPYQSIDKSFQGELATTFQSIKAYQQATYYVGTWSPDYDVWVNMLLSIYQGPLGRTFAFDMALSTDMVFTQPIVYELPNLKMRTALMIGDKDNTAIGKAWAPPEVVPLLGHYETLGKQVSARIPNSTLINFPGLGHSPQIQSPAGFHEALLAWLT
ncbi:hypothetical protein PVAG01_11233 [Phlyctema vagabunda]|uniref:AB hydrolase-1 domain-containing protein n=1 Tax=Phlyctema vagabunda TaxID=108571 RepID=A0ABR4P1Q4_9HELO